VEHTIVSLRPYLLSEKLEKYSKLQGEFKSENIRRSDKLISSLIKWANGLSIESIDDQNVV
jgi:hypothetical protein